MKLPSEYVAMLEEHCAKLEEIENWLYEQWKATGEKETVDLCLQAQQQLRLTAQELLKQSPVRSERKEPVKNTEPRANVLPQSPAQILAAARAKAAAAKK